MQKLSPLRGGVKMRSTDPKTITGGQMRAARALVRWSAEDLAREAMLGVATVRRAEASDGPVQMTAANAAAVTRALESAGIEFTNGDAPAAGFRATGKAQTIFTGLTRAKQSKNKKAGSSKLNPIALPREVQW